MYLDGYGSRQWYEVKKEPSDVPEPSLSSSEAESYPLTMEPISDNYQWSTLQTQCRAMLKLLQKDKFNDVTFLIGSEKKEFKANKTFLAAQSAVFEAMLFGQMMESQLNSEIEINDAEPDAFEAVLKYCYCNNPELSSINVVGIKKIADKYQINGLSKSCDDHFPKCLNQNNFCELLTESMDAKLRGVYQT